MLYLIYSCILLAWLVFSLALIELLLIITLLCLSFGKMNKDIQIILR